MEKQSKMNLSLPVAIVIAGVLIAGAIVLAKRTPTGATATDSPLSQALATAEAINIKPASIKDAIEDRDMQDRVARDVNNAKELGISGTPYSIVIGPDGTRFPVGGAFPIEYFEKVIDLMKNGAPRTAEAYDITDVQNLYTAVMEQGLLPRIKDDTTDKLLAIDPAIDHIRGTVDAPITIVEYSDLECPYCQAHHNTLTQLVTDNTDIRWVYRHFPLTTIHKGAQLKAEASEVIAAQSGNEVFWQFVDKNFETLGAQ